MRRTSTESVKARLASERGASLSVAMLLMLVCVALTAAVLAASTASAGRFADQGEMDERYYAVTSAVQLFRDPLGTDDAIAFKFTQQQKTEYAKPGGSPNWTNEPVNLVEPTGTITATDQGDSAGYNFLPKLTLYALFGQTDRDTSTNSEVGASDFVLPFSSSGLVGGTKDFKYTIAPKAGTDLAGKHIDVEVVARLSRQGNEVDDDWKLEFDFYNTKNKRGDDASGSERFHAYMAFVADVVQDDSYSESVKSVSQQVIDGNKVTVSTMEAVRERQTTVTWHLQQIVTGRGLQYAGA